MVIGYLRGLTIGALCTLTSGILVPVIQVKEVADHFTMYVVTYATLTIVLTSAAT